MYLKRLKNLRENHDKTQQEIADYYETSLDYICERTNTTDIYNR